VRICIRFGGRVANNPPNYKQRRFSEEVQIESALIENRLQFCMCFLFRGEKTEKETKKDRGRHKADGKILKNPHVNDPFEYDPCALRIQPQIQPLYGSERKKNVVHPPQKKRSPT
jgi:hypothetical protein